MTDCVLDASAVLADLLDEPGAERVRAVIHGAFVSAVNYAEAISKLIDKGLDPDEARKTVDELPCVIVPVEKACAADAAMLRAATRSAGLSLGDRMCLALARQLDLPALTAERTWKRLELGVDVELIR
jgi:PIN domain nuclease of toxin-antitoxin system